MEIRSSFNIKKIVNWHSKYKIKDMKKILLSLAVILTISMSAQDCSDLFISEYVESIHNNNAIEIYNPTASSIDLAGYTINRYSNGASSGPESWQLGGAIASGDAIVVGNGQMDSVWISTYWSLPVDPLFYSMLDCYCAGDYDANSTFYFNGNDAITLEKNGNIIDIVGKVGEDPGESWTCDTSGGFTSVNASNWNWIQERWWTKRHTLVRKSSVKQGITQNPILFNPTLEWDSLPDATYTQLGQHTCDCNTPSSQPSYCLSTSIQSNSKVSYIIYPNPSTKGQQVIINTQEKIDIVEVYNVLGEKIITEESNIILTKKLLKGMYLIKIYFKNGKSVTNKLVVE
ncbi:MAG: T9SS type A sorting domain-containing protein [Flavobacteriales bacterium]|jgi:hypothetical protein|nr:T9SS type A sorting domain-containing protein [Flavobacteriales bacterium]MBT5354330.1 T9SS type A sorting domain-containing protein [Flavobacteriales bacterium]MBT5699388.1 T9SS type A sorting domain-containing protein [Flavobacteriales bacterium]MBT6814814.1 T9SS type A sorting domain-containing protein [Flavobacteriales bacterium]MBT7726837.1 T9SS type A sorting domain-containing protein [Flavobacteriales bacterium]